MDITITKEDECLFERSFFTEPNLPSVLTDSLTSIFEKHDPKQIHSDEKAEAVLQYLVSRSSDHNTEFFRSYWQKKPYFINREKMSHYSHIFSKTTLSKILKKQVLRVAADINFIYDSMGGPRYFDPSEEDNEKTIATKAIWDKFDEGK